jgi:DNA-directed RNA polymerase subunit RPC12/RpoP
MNCSDCDGEMGFFDMQEMLGIRYETLACPRCGNRFVKEMLL